MRIIGGEFKGYRFNPPANNWPTRPTTDFSKEALYNILQNRLNFDEIRFLDLFGGSGNHCYEMISRGAIHATYVDKFGGCVSFVKTMLEKLKISDKVSIVKMDVFKYIASTNQTYNLIFAGPPYALKTIGTIPDKIMTANILEPNGLLILEHNPRIRFDDHEYLEEVRNYGQTYFSFFRSPV